jgi:hypothetical protein
MIQLHDIPPSRPRNIEGTPFSEWCAVNHGTTNTPRPIVQIALALGCASLRIVADYSRTGTGDFFFEILEYGARRWDRWVSFLRPRRDMRVIAMMQYDAMQGAFWYEYWERMNDRSSTNIHTVENSQYGGEREVMGMLTIFGVRNLIIDGA